MGWFGRRFGALLGNPPRLDRWDPPPDRGELCAGFIQIFKTQGCPNASGDEVFTLSSLNQGAFVSVRNLLSSQIDVIARISGTALVSTLLVVQML